MTAPPSVSVRRALGQPGFDPGVAFRLAIIGCASTSPLSAGTLSSPYGNPDLLAADYGIGDGVDAAYMCLRKTDDNPQPPALSFYRTPATTNGVRGSLITTGVTGSCTVTQTAATYPKGTYQPRVRVVVGGTIGVAGIVLEASLDNGNTWLPTAQLSTATTFEITIPNPNGSAYATGVKYDLGAGTLTAGDEWHESKTVPPRWVIGDIYTSGSPATGALPVIASSSLNFGLVAITEPVIASDIAVLSAALDAMVAIHASFRPTLFVRFRDQIAGESESTFIAALATFRAACADDARIQVWAGDGQLLDAQRSFLYSRSGLPAYLARHQGMAARAGKKGERIAQSPGWTARGPLPFFKLRDSSGAVTGHDEVLRPGALGPFTGKGGFACAYYGSHEGREGTYACVIEPVLYGPTSTVKTSMDNRVSSALERILGAIAFDNLGGADIVVDDVLDEDVCLSMAAQAQEAIQKNLPNEFENWNDHNLVTVDPNVTEDSEGAVAINWYVADELFGYTNAITVTLANGRT